MTESQDVTSRLREENLARLNGTTRSPSIKRGPDDLKLWAALNEALPNWRETNAKPGFLNWLETKDETTGRVRQMLLNEARQNMDVTRVVAIFKEWDEYVAQEAMMKNQNTAINNDDGFISRGWIGEQNRLYAKGYYKHRRTQWATIQELIDRAARENRIR